MLQKPTRPSHCTRASGQPAWSAQGPTSSMPTFVWRSVSPPQEVGTAGSPTQEPTCRQAHRNADLATRGPHHTGGRIWYGVQQTKVTPTASQTSIHCQQHSASHGRSPRTATSQIHRFSQGWNGTSERAQWASPCRRSTNTWRPSRSGRHKPNARTRSSRCRDSTVSCYIAPWLYHEDAHTLPAWRPCSGYAVTVLSYHTTPFSPYAKTWNGGLTPYSNPSSTVPSPTPSGSQTSPLSLTQAWASASQSPWVTAGVPGDSSPDGAPLEACGTSGGLRQSASNYLSSASPALRAWTEASSFKATTPESSRAGATSAAETPPSTSYSDKYSTTYTAPATPTASTSPMSLALATPPTDPLAAYTRLRLSSFLPYQPLPASASFSSTPLSPSHPSSSDSTAMACTQRPQPNALTRYWTTLGPSNSERPMTSSNGGFAATDTGVSQTVTSRFDGLAPLPSSVSTR
ncbi:hypothetical protein DAEQUDRAFT_585765 [Daedalea quercina L-15889]|uniref:Uncharacterized protein n=1 Tax=Daedalea quercina L-15889 TaxID=1314783 RepID=A0A165LQY7_9APHY|nr:hypothetical protein DAEQUDRAFT_585765 [Daedalea quercina L-15889]